MAQDITTLSANAMLPWTAVHPAPSELPEPFFKASGTVADRNTLREKPRHNWALDLRRLSTVRVFATVTTTPANGAPLMYSASCQSHWGVKSFLEVVAMLGTGPSRDAITDATNMAEREIYPGQQQRTSRP